MNLPLDSKFVLTLKKKIQVHPEPVGFLSGALSAAILLLSFWGPVSNAIRECLINERQLVCESFSIPLAKALASGDDLAGVDELRRLQKIPGVALAKVIQKEGNLQGFPLIWQGKKVGGLELKMSMTHVKRWRYHALERAWSLMLISGSLGGLAGWGLRRARRRMRGRLVSLSKLQHKNHLVHLQRLKSATQDNLTEWTRQAMRLSPYGLILLDEGQRVVAFNRKAQEMLKLDAGTTGSHWMDVNRSPEWAAALRHTLDHPGESVMPYQSGALRGVSLISYAKNDTSIITTWIVIHSAAFVPAVRELA